MGVDISHIIRHDFRQVNDREASRAFVNETIKRLKQNLFIYEEDEEFQYRYDEGLDETTFKLPVYDFEFILQNGFWQIESYYHYCQIAMHHGDYFRLRRMTFDIARALGQDEAWYATEYYTWNGEACEEPGVTFEQWMDHSTQKYGKPIPEFDQAAIMSQGDVHIPDNEPIYHDSFKECKELYENLQSKLGEYKLLSLDRYGNDFLRCEKDGLLYLVSERTLKPLFDEPIDGVTRLFSDGPKLAIKRNGLSALFDTNGLRLTDFVKGEFKDDF